MTYKYNVWAKNGAHVGATCIKEVADLMTDWVNKNSPEAAVPDNAPRKVKVKIYAGTPRSLIEQGEMQYVINFLPESVGDRKALIIKLGISEYAAEKLVERLATYKPSALTGRYVEVEFDRKHLTSYQQVRQFVVRDVFRQLADQYTRVQIADWMHVSRGRVSDLLYQMNHGKPDDEWIEPQHYKGLESYEELKFTGVKTKALHRL